MLSLVAAKNSLTNLAQPQSAGNTYNMEMDDTVLLPVKWTLEIIISANPAGIESAAHTTVMMRFSELAISENAAEDAETELAITATPATMDNKPASPFFFTG